MRPRTYTITRVGRYTQTIFATPGEAVDYALRAVSTIVITIVEILGCVRLATSSPGPRPAVAEAIKKGRSSSKKVGAFG